MPYEPKQRRNRGMVSERNRASWERRMDRAIAAIQSGSMSQERAAKMYRISAGTIKRERERRCRAADQDQ